MANYIFCPGRSVGRKAHTNHTQLTLNHPHLLPPSTIQDQEQQTKAKANKHQTAMFDLTEDPTSLALIQTFASAKKPIAAVCHGPCVFLNATTPSGTPLLSGAEVTGFSNTEEDQAQLSAAMPFMLETELGRVSGGKYVKADQPWGEKVVVSRTAGIGGVLITGQNPASATGVGEEILKALGV